VVANVSFGASVVLYNAFLPEIAPPGERDAVSSRGWALGYLGGGLLLAANLAFVARAGDVGLTTVDAVRISLTSAGLWWGVFTLVPMATLQTREPVRRLGLGERYLTVWVVQLWETIVRLGHDPSALRFLLAYLLYNDGIQTVITLASQFGQEELGLPVSTLAAVILMVQFVAFAGSLAFGRLAGVVGTKGALVASLLVWVAAILYAAGLMRTGRDFVILAITIGVVLGGSQALSRSAYSTMIPKGQEAEYFGLYEVSDRGTSWLGPLLYGLMLQLTGSYRLLRPWADAIAAGPPQAVR
jgi:UMF1 family MFS transporter